MTTLTFENEEQKNRIYNRTVEMLDRVLPKGSDKLLYESYEALAWDMVLHGMGLTAIEYYLKSVYSNTYDHVLCNIFGSDDNA